MQDGFSWAGTHYDDGSCDSRWQNGNVWIVEYEFYQGFPRKNYICYRAVATVPTGLKPWQVDNKRINSEPLLTLGDAMDVANAYIKKTQEQDT